jgi:type IV secretion system protein TrbJ
VNLFWRRNDCMARCLCAVVALVSASPARAQITAAGCGSPPGPCASWLEQTIQYAEQAAQLIQETTTAEQEVVNTIKLPETLFQDASSEIAQITGLAKQADLLVGNTGQFITNLGASSYPTGPLNNPMAEIVKEQNAISNAIKQLGSVIDVENPLLAPRATILAAMNNQSLTAAGRLQALQAAQGVGATTGQQLHSLETILLSMAQGQHATMLSQADRQALEDKALDVMSQYTVDQPNDPGF